MMLAVGYFLMGFGLAGLLRNIYEIYTLLNPSTGNK